VPEPADIIEAVGQLTAEEIERRLDALRDQQAVLKSLLRAKLARERAAVQRPKKEAQHER
jgi:hypothetical protein